MADSLRVRGPSLGSTFSNRGASLLLPEFREKDAARAVR
jgi:hypothetical protein